MLLTGRVVGVDKINHFIREGQTHFDDVGHGRGLDDTLRAALGESSRPLAMTEHGFKGRALTGVLSYADLAASYAGFNFWRDLLTLERPGSFVDRDATTNRFVVRRPFTFATYVTDAWDEAINPSDLHPELGREVAAVLRSRNAAIRDCSRLAQLPDAQLYVNPGCFVASDPRSQIPDP